MTKMIKTVKHTLATAMLGAFLTACQNLPSTTPHLPKSIALTDEARTVHTQLKHAKLTPAPALVALTSHISHSTDDKLSAYYPISTSADAFWLRHTLTGMAKHSIDVQYYIWHADEAGFIMLKQLWDSAERGVKVRVLIDDFNSSPTLDSYLLTFASHPNIAVRLANPFVYRHSKTVSYLKNPIRQNVRMHNKSMTFDAHVSIIGGRNIGNEYLNVDAHNYFADLDVVLAGKVVSEVVDSFEAYWQSAHAYDIENLTKTPLPFLPSPEDFARLDNVYTQATAHASLKHHMANGQLPFRWTTVRFFADHVGKLDRSASYDDYLVSQLRQHLPTPTQRLSIVSSYFAPTKEGVQILTNLAKQGVRISILTNALNATDVPTVHAGYGHWRQELLKAGVQLYELKRNATPKTWFANPNAHVSLHAKMFAIDKKHVFIGSYNIDPRSANINTELGVVIIDEALATQLHVALNNSMDNVITNPNLQAQTYELGLDDNGKLIWQTLENDKPVIYHSEPKTSLPKRLGIGVLSMLPIDGLL